MSTCVYINHYMHHTMYVHNNVAAFSDCFQTPDVKCVMCFLSKHQTLSENIFIIDKLANWKSL